MKLSEINSIPKSLIVLACFFALLMISCDSLNEEKVSPTQKKTEVIIPSIRVKNLTIDKHGLILGKVEYSVVKNVSFSKSGKLERGDVPLVVGTPFKFNEVLVNLNIEEAFKELAQSKLSFSKKMQSFEVQIEKKIPSELIKWRKFEEDLAPSKRLPQFPTIYSELEKALIVEDDIYIMFTKLRNQESEIEQYFYLAPFDGVITAVFKNKSAQIERNQTVLKIAKKDVFNAEFSVSKMHYDELKKLETIDFVDKNNTKIGSGKIKKADKLNSGMKLHCSFNKINGIEIVNNQPIYIAFPNFKNTGCYLPKNAVNAEKVVILLGGKEIKKPVIILQDVNEQLFVSGLKDGEIVLIK